jgi:hypothetical protein
MPNTKTSPSRKCETPFGKPNWAWNHVPLCGIPTRERCRSIVSQEEAEAGSGLISEYRRWETVAAKNDIDSRQQWLDKEGRQRTVSGVEIETLRREMAAADHSKFLEAQDKLQELRKKALELAEQLFKRLAKDLNEQLHETTVGAEQRLAEAGLPIKVGDAWVLHDDSLSKSLWSCRHIVEKTLSGLSPDNAIGATQWLCSSEEGVPFQFAS